MKKSGIYKIVCTKNRRVYVGSAVDIINRWGWHRHALRNGRHHSVILLRCWQKYGESAFRFRIIELIPKPQLLKREQYWINKLGAYGPKGMNISPKAVSSLGLKRTSETRKKLSESAKRVASDPDERKRRSERAKRQHRLGVLGSHTLTPEGIRRRAKKVSTALKGRRFPAWRKKQYTSEEMRRRSLMRDMKAVGERTRLRWVVWRKNHVGH